MGYAHMQILTLSACLLAIIKKEGKSTRIIDTSVVVSATAIFKEVMATRCCWHMVLEQDLPILRTQIFIISCLCLYTYRLLHCNLQAVTL